MPLPGPATTTTAPSASAMAASRCFSFSPAKTEPSALGGAADAIVDPRLWVMRRKKGEGARRRGGEREREKGEGAVVAFPLFFQCRRGAALQRTALSLALSVQCVQRDGQNGRKGQGSRERETERR